MSAICGVIGRDGRPAHRRDIGRALTGLTPLGHHGLHDWAGQAGGMGVAVGVALRRRVPEDAADVQPILHPSGLVLVADVVLANRARLAARLGIADRSDVPDSRLLLAAYQKWDRDCLAELVGSFAFAIVDPFRGGVLLARDHVGDRPLHVHTGSGRLAFASTALALTDIDGVGHDLDTGRLAEYLAGVVATQRSWVAGVVPLPPGSALWVDSTAIRHWRHWQVEAIEPAKNVSSARAVAGLRLAFDAAVESAGLRSRPVGIALSGGLDSTSVAATAAAALTPDTIRTYTAGPPAGWRGSVPPGYEADETPLVVRLVGRHPNLRPCFLDAVGEPFFAGYEDLFDAGGTPPEDPVDEPWLRVLYRQAAADGIGTLLTGTGGGAYFSADDPAWLSALAGQGRLLTARREARAWAAASGESAARLLGGALTPGALGRGRPGRRALESWFAGSGLRPELRGEVDLSTVLGLGGRADAAGATAGGLPWGVGPGGTGGAVGPVALAALAAQAEHRAALAAAHHLHRVDPARDIRVIEVAAGLPPWLRRSGGLGRAGARAAMADRLPDEIRLRTVRGLSMPDWLDRLSDARAELGAELRAARDDRLAAEYIDLPRLEAAVRDWPAPAAAAAPELTALYRQALPTALLAGRYVRWFDSRREASLLRRTAAEVPAAEVPGGPGVGG